MGCMRLKSARVTRARSPSAAYAAAPMTDKPRRRVAGPGQGRSAMVESGGVTSTTD